MKSKEGKVINLTRSVVAPIPLEPIVNKGWKPTANEDHITYTMPFGGAQPASINVNPPKSKKEGE